MQGNTFKVLTVVHLGHCDKIRHAPVLITVVIQNIGCYGALCLKGTILLCTVISFKSPLTS